MTTIRRSVGPAANSMAAKRIRKEMQDLTKENLGAMSLIPNESNIFLWRATLPGPAGSPYEGGEFEVDIRIPEDYPFSPPHLQFITKVYHCNIASTGGICLDLLKHAWSPALSLYKVILSLSSLLTDPNPADPLVPAIASEYKRDKKTHDRTATEWTKLYATPKKPIAQPAPPPPAPIQSSTTTATASSRRPAARTRVVPPTAPPPQIAGTRRTHSTTQVLDSDDSDIEVVESSSAVAGIKAKKDERPSKRTKTGAGTGSGGGVALPGGSNADDVIVIDE